MNIICRYRKLSCVFRVQNIAANKAKGDAMQPSTTGPTIIGINAIIHVHCTYIIVHNCTECMCGVQTGSD